MNSRVIFLFFILFLATDSQAQQSTSDITTFILVRHAEKADDSRDPDLSNEGVERAESLAHMLSEMKIDAVYSTNLTRTIETARKIADDNGLEIQTYGVQAPDETVSEWTENHRGDVILISGHSNTTPTFANALLGREHFKGPFSESDYGNILIITISRSGENRLLHLRY